MNHNHFEERLLNHHHDDRGVYHDDCSACRFLSRLMADAGFAQPNQAAYGHGDVHVKALSGQPVVLTGGGAGGGSSHAGTYQRFSPVGQPPLDPPTATQLRMHLSRDHKLPLDLSRPVLVRVHQACHRRNHFNQRHYDLTKYSGLHSDCVILVYSHNLETSESVQNQLRSTDQVHREARQRQVADHGDREAVLHSQRVTAAIGKAKAGLEALQKTNARRAELFQHKIARAGRMHQAKGLELHYGFDKPYTYAIAQLVDDTGVKPYLGLGTARCSDDDPWDPAMGCQLATGRALEDIGKQMLIGATYVDELRNARRGRV